MVEVRPLRRNPIACNVLGWGPAVEYISHCGSSVRGIRRRITSCCARLERNLKARNVLLLGLAGLILGCEGRLSPDEAGMLDAVAFVIGGQQEGAQQQGFETRWRRTVEGQQIQYESIHQNTGFREANAPHPQSRHVKVDVSISSPQKCIFKTVIMTAYSKGTSKESFYAPSKETTTLDFNKVQRIELEQSNPPTAMIH